MDPRHSTVYADTWSPLTWVLILSVVIVCVMTLMVSFIALVHRSIEHSVDTPRQPAPDLTAVPAPTAETAAGLPRSPHAA